MQLLDYAQLNKIPFIYASSASVYGNGVNGYKESNDKDFPLNPYGYSKYLFDKFLQNNDKYFKSNKVIGLRFFNVYGPREFHKTEMSSPIYKFFHDFTNYGFCKVFNEYKEYKHNHYQRDFVYIDDCINILMFFYKNKVPSGIYNVGSGKTASFLDIAELIRSELKKYSKKKFKINYIPFPKDLIGNYQFFTKADLNKIRSIGYDEKFISIENGIQKYIDYLWKDKI